MKILAGKRQSEREHLVVPLKTAKERFGVLSQLL